MYKSIKHIHFVGIGGIGMSGIAKVLLKLKYKVSGSDLAPSEMTESLKKQGAIIFIGHKEENINGAQVVVYSSACKKENPELTQAKRQNIPLIPRAEMLAELMRLKYGIAVAGTHGKTTTTSLVSTILGVGGFDPTVVIGGKINTLETNAKLGKGDFFVAEADESDRSFLSLSPTIAIVTNIDPEHLENYKDFNEVKKCYLEFINKIPFYGAAILCLDEPNVKELIPQVNKRIITYGLDQEADYWADEIKFNGTQTYFRVFKKKEFLGKIKVSLTGVHNVKNCLAAIALAKELNIPFNIVKRALNLFSGVQRRFQILGLKGGTIVVDDYGHHPQEIIATLQAAKDCWGKRLIVAFQPHRYSRTFYLFKDFVGAFKNADILVITDIYAASEPPIEGVHAKKLVEAIKKEKKECYYLSPKEKIIPFLKEYAKANDVVITLGAGDIWRIGREFLNG